jgi:hypothetical protein
MTTPIQIGDIARINVQGVNYDIIIDRIDPEAIYASSYVIIPQNNTWQVKNYPLPHTVSFLSGTPSISVPKPISSPSFVPRPIMTPIPKPVSSPSFVPRPITTPISASRPVTIPVSRSVITPVSVPTPITTPIPISKPSISIQGPRPTIPVPRPTIPVPRPTIPVPRPTIPVPPIPIPPIPIPVTVPKPTTTSISPHITIPISTSISISPRVTTPILTPTHISPRATTPILTPTPISPGATTPVTTPIATPIITPTPISTPPLTLTAVSEEPPIFALYSRTGPRKILLTLQPRLYKVVYSPAGIQFLGLDRNKLPNYVLITNLLAQRANDLVLIPYVKDRSQTETEWLIRNQPIPLEYNIVDIIPSKREVTNPPPIFEKSQVFAVYSRTGPRKILMLLEPGSYKLTYTPAGIQFLNLHRDKLPSYELTTNLLVRQAQDFVLVPYIKGRSEQEIERLMSEQPEYNISDIFPGGMYTGEYGNISRVGQSLKSVTFCQGEHYFFVGRSPRGTELYDEYITLSENFGDPDFMDPGVMMMGKNNDYVVTSDMRFDSILADVRKCGRVYYLIGATKDIGKSIKSPEEYHAIAIVIDPKQHLCEVMDPNGMTPDTRHIYFWINKLVDYLKQHGIDVERKLTVDEPFCPQGLAASAPEFKKEGQCLAVSFWYIWLRVNNPTVPPEAIRRYMMKMTPEESYDRISRVATIAFGS